MILFPTTDLPPNSFGTSENWGFLGGTMLLYEPPTLSPQKGTILLGYFTKKGSIEERVNQENAIKLDTAPYD
jgi:hypothetical protein